MEEIQRKVPPHFLIGHNGYSLCSRRQPQRTHQCLFLQKAKITESSDCYQFCVQHCVTHSTYGIVVSNPNNTTWKELLPSPLKREELRLEERRQLAEVLPANM